MDIKITKKNGDTFTFEEFDIWVEDFIVSSIPLSPVYDSPEGSDRQVDYGATYGNRTIRVPFTARANDLHDYPLLRDFLFEKILDKESFYIQEMRRPKKLAYAFVDTNEVAAMQEGTDNRTVNGKRYLVRLQNTFELEQMEADGKGELVFETTELPFAESIGTTRDIQVNGVADSYELWGEGMGIIPDKESYVYKHNSTSFRVYNAGNVPIHPFEHDLRISISNVEDSDGYYELRNLTNGTVFRTKESVTSNQVITIEGPVVKSNGLQYFREVNSSFIELEPGWNEIVASKKATVEFNFRFYYK